MTSHSASGASCGSDSAEEPRDADETPSPVTDKKKKKKKKRQTAVEEEKNKKKGKERKKKEEEEEEEPEEEEEEEKLEEEEEERSESVLLRGIFRLGKISHDVLLTSTRLSWTPILPEMPTVQVSESQWARIPMRDVFAVKVKRRCSAGQQTGGPVLGVTLFYGRTTIGRRLTDDKLHLHNSSVQHCDVWFRTIKDILSGFSTRPKRLLVFINPGSHKKEAVHIYRQHVAPLFNMADLKTEITITEKKGHALSVLKECNQDEFDGVVCVGGDGSVAEIAHGLVLRAQLEDQEDRESWTLSDDDEPRRAFLPLGIIPAGSTDIVSCSVHGVRHPPTAALHIILGHLQPVDMCSFSSQGRLVTFGFSAMFGFGGRSLALAERKRWMPTSQRREYALLKTLAKLRPVDCDLSFLPALSNQSLFEDGSKETYTEGEEPWLQTNQSLYLNISIMSIPCLSPHTPYGLSKTRLANGSGELIAAGNTSRSEFIRHLKRYGSKTGQFDFPFVEKHTVAAVKLRPRLPIGWQQQEEEESEDSQEVDDPKTTPILSSERKGFPWNIDGELICIPNEVLVRVHSSLITLYGGEYESAEEASISCSCI